MDSFGRKNRGEDVAPGDRLSEKKERNISGTADGRRWNAARTAYLGMFIAVAMVLSYLESFIPVNIAVPGVKLGLANLAAIVVMYRMSSGDAWLVSMVRIFLSSLLFGNMAVMMYSIAGAVFSLTVMMICKKLDLFGLAGVSIAGAVSHNAGQVIVAALLMKSGNIMLYIPVLCISGTIAGVCIGIAGAVLVKNLPNLGK